MLEPRRGGTPASAPEQARCRARGRDLVEHARASVERLRPAHRIVDQILSEAAGGAERSSAQVCEELLELLVEFSGAVADLAHNVLERLHGFGIDDGGPHDAQDDQRWV